MTATTGVVAPLEAMLIAMTKEMSPCIIELMKNYGCDILDKAGQIYGFDAEEAKTILIYKKIESNVKLLSYTNSQTAKNGYKEEELVCNDLIDERIKKAFAPILGINYTEFSRIKGTHKRDIQSDDMTIGVQVKRYKKKQFQQIDRHWIDNLIEKIPELGEVLQILKDLFELPLLPNGTHVDKSKKLKKLCDSNYSHEILDKFLSLLNKYKKEIIEYAFLGNDLEMAPEYLIGVEYKNNKRDKIVLFKLQDIIMYLEKLDFEISPQKTNIIMMNGIIRLQRKGGDGGRKPSNNLQIKFILSDIIDKIHNLEYKL